MVFKEIIAVYSENHTKPINTKLSISVNADGSYTYRSALMVKIIALDRPLLILKTQLISHVCNIVYKQNCSLPSLQSLK
jgi:hypothetical protein